MSKRLPYEVGRTWKGDRWSLFWSECRECGAHTPGWDYARNARWAIKCHVQQDHPELVTWSPVPPIGHVLTIRP